MNADIEEMVKNAPLALISKLLQSCSLQEIRHPRNLCSRLWTQENTPSLAVEQHNRLHTVPKDNPTKAYIITYGT